MDKPFLTTSATEINPVRRRMGRVSLWLFVTMLMLAPARLDRLLAQGGNRSGPSDQSRAKILLDIAVAQELAGDKPGAAQSLKKARELESKITDDGLRTAYLEVLGGMLLTTGAKEEAAKVAGQSDQLAQAQAKASKLAMSGHNWRNAASIYASLGKMEAYLKAMKAALAAYEKAGGADSLEEEWRSRWLSQLVETQLLAGDDENALKTAGMIVAEVELRGEVLVAIVESQLKRGEVDKARKTFQSVPRSLAGLRLDGNLEFAKRAYRKGETDAYAKSLEASFATAAEIEGGDLYGEGLIDILSAQHEIKDAKGSKVTVEKIVAHAIQQRTPETISDLAVHQIEQLDDKAAGLATLARAMAMAVAVKEKDEERQSWTLISIAVGYAKAGEMEKAAETAAKIERSSNQADAYTQLADLQIGAGDEAGARKSLSSALKASARIKSEEERSEQILRIVDGWAELKDFKTAFKIARSIPQQDYQEQSLEELKIREQAIKKGGAPESEGEEPWTLSQVPDQLTTAGERAKALEAAANALDLIGETEAARRTRDLAKRQRAAPSQD